MVVNFCDTTAMYPVNPDVRRYTDVFECAECKHRVHLGEFMQEYECEYCACCGKAVESISDYRMRKAFANGAWNCTFEEYKLFQCSECSKENCPHREAYRRVPMIDGGLALCPRLAERKRKNT